MNTKKHPSFREVLKRRPWTAKPGTCLVWAGCYFVVILFYILHGIGCLGIAFFNLFSVPHKVLCEYNGFTLKRDVGQASKKLAEAMKQVENKSPAQIIT